MRLNNNKNNKNNKKYSLPVIQFVEEQTQLKPSSQYHYKYVLSLLFRYLNTDPEHVSKSDVLAFLNSEKFKNYEVSSQNNMKIILKRFLEWYGKDASYIKLVNDVDTKLDPKIILSRNQLKTLLAHMNAMDKAIIMVLFEGLRVSELINLKIKHFTAEGESGVLYVTVSKSSKRPVPLVRSVPYIINWLNQHPKREDKNAWLFGHQWKGEFTNYTRTAIWQRIDRYNHLIPEVHLHPHLFRHNSATYDGRAGIPRTQICMKHGWKDSRMMERYSHLTDQDVKSIYFEKYGFTHVDKQEDPKDLIDKITCHRCGTPNPESNQYCAKCGALLDITRLHKIEKTSDRLQDEYSKDELFKMFQLFMKQREKEKKKKPKTKST